MYKYIIDGYYIDKITLSSGNTYDAGLSSENISLIQYTKEYGNYSFYSSQSDVMYEIYSNNTYDLYYDLTEENEDETIYTIYFNADFGDYGEYNYDEYCYSEDECQDIIDNYENEINDVVYGGLTSPSSYIAESFFNVYYQSTYNYDYTPVDSSDSIIEYSTELGSFMYIEGSNFNNDLINYINFSEGSSYYHSDCGSKLFESDVNIDFRYKNVYIHSDNIRYGDMMSYIYDESDNVYEGYGIEDALIEELIYYGYLQYRY